MTFKSFIETIVAVEKSGGSYNINLTKLRGIICSGFLYLELPIRKIINETLTKIFTEYKEKQLKDEFKPV